MMQKTLFSKTNLQYSLFSLVLFFLVAVTSCGKNEGSDGEDLGDGVLDVSASLTDWAVENGSYKDFNFVLFDTLSSRAYRNVVDANGRISLSKIPQSQNYVAFMLDNEFRFGWVMQFADTSDGKVYQYFNLLSGTIGALFPEGGIMRMSKPLSLRPIKNYTFLDKNSNGLPDGLESDVAHAENVSASNTTDDLTGEGGSDAVNPDLDRDGLPNVLDFDSDNNGIDDLFDTDLNHDGIDDQQKPFQATSTWDVSRRNIFHEFVVGSDNKEKTNLWIMIEFPNFVPKNVSVVSGTFLDGAVFKESGEAFDGKLYDDGTHGDGQSKDAIWSASIQLATGKTFNNNQVVVFKATLPDDTEREYLYTFNGKMSGTLTVSKCSKGTSGVDVAWTASTELTSKAGLSNQVLIYDADNRLVYSSARLAVSTSSLTIPTTVFTSGKTYNCTVRTLAPSPIAGYPGSSRQAKPKSYTAP